MSSFMAVCFWFRSTPLEALPQEHLDRPLRWTLRPAFFLRAIPHTATLVAGRELGHRSLIPIPKALTNTHPRKAHSSLCMRVPSPPLTTPRPSIRTLPKDTLIPSMLTILPLGGLRSLPSSIFFKRPRIPAPLARGLASGGATTSVRMWKQSEEMGPEAVHSLLHGGPPWSETV
ncbi:hypothetical protein BDM02DRAFT_1273955 [Thelephora ganbajun]|uniref:Uncharacterized protein n=1 Tax=Thelephora ganbajun TaxID=370292 RepID=A0ACB6Z363_THEGA|nr:hypothetical protein BDM02DRAFT_1273955 [Thelephora ganbajun]